MKDTERQEKEDKLRSFMEHLERASKTVKTWPKWKQEALGGFFDEEITKEKEKTIDPS
ncbi:hypothetical protein ABK046_45570 [Streptomyces caeruleatus]